MLGVSHPVPTGARALATGHLEPVPLRPPFGGELLGPAANHRGPRPARPPPPTEVSEAEIEGALALMDTMTVDELEGPEFQDRYTEAIAQVIEAKREDKPLPQAPEPEQPAAVLDLMAALQESVSKAKASRGESAGPAEVHELPQPKKTAAKKQPEKAAAKKTGAKKSAGRRPRSA